MPRIFDNIDLSLLPALKETLGVAERADFCVGYFNLRGWRHLDQRIQEWSGGPGHCCRLLVGMQRLPEEELRTALSLARRGEGIDLQAAARIKRRLAEEFRDQLAAGIPNDEDEAGLRRLASQIKGGKVVVKLFVRHPLHAKLYLLFRPDPVNPKVAFLGSSNLTFAGLAQQGELNVDVLDHDACAKLAAWFEERWDDRFCLDISDDLAAIIDESWAREEPVPPYHIYLKMAYHLSQEARAGLAEFRIPRDFGNRLLAFQTAAVKIAAHHLNKRGGVLLGDVVGLGKTLMATALARIFEDDYGLETLIICPKNLVRMWEGYRDLYRLRARVLPITRAISELPALRRFRLVLIDESHNLRNREGRRYRAILEYIQENESKVILLSATPYNKSYLDLSSQLRLFVPEDRNLGVRPEQYLRHLGETEFIRKHQCSPHTLAAFEKSDVPDDWRELMRLYLVRRTRTFVKDNYARTDPANARKYLIFEDGARSYFPERRPRKVAFQIDDSDRHDQFARLYAEPVVDTINSLSLPRYGLGNYIAPAPHDPPTTAEARVLADLSRAGKRLMGFCRTNLFKRLESSGHAFLLSVERHVLRNFVYLHALDHGLPLPIGTQDSVSLDTRAFDDDPEAGDVASLFDGDATGEANGRGGDDGATGPDNDPAGLRSEEAFRDRAAEIYQLYRAALATRFKWLRPHLFVSALAADLLSDSYGLIQILRDCGQWDPGHDRKLAALADIVSRSHRDEKVLVFSQFADTVHYLERQLKARCVASLAGATGDSPDPTELAWRFAPEANERRHAVPPAEELRVLVATDVLSEGQNLQDCAVVVNYDLPWAIIRLIQRVGRVDRIGQRAETIHSYSFLPAEGVERIIRLRARVRERLRENAEVVGTDEVFFGDEKEHVLVDLYNEKAGLLDGDEDGEVDLASFAYQIWKNAIDADPSLARKIDALADVVYSTKLTEAPSPDAPSGAGAPTPPSGAGALARPPEGVLVYLRTSESNDALAWLAPDGTPVTQSQLAILKAAACAPDTPAQPRRPDHHALLARAVATIVEEERAFGGQLGRPTGARFRTFERLKSYLERIKGTLFDLPELHRAADEIYRHTLRPTAVDTLNRQLRSGISDEKLAELVLALRDEDRLCIVSDEERITEPRIICSMGLTPGGEV